MYKVFLNERVITVCPSSNPEIIKDSVIRKNLNAIDETKAWFREFIETDVQHATIIHLNPEVFWHKIFLPSFKIILAAGGIVIRKQKLLFIYRNEKWDLPKGKVDSGETDSVAALREVAEECGIFGHHIVATLPSSFHLFQSPYPETFGEWILKETRWFEMEYTGVENGTPQTEENITKIKWVAKNELGEILQNTWANLKPVIKLFYE